MLKRVLMIAGPVALVLALALLIFKWVTAPIELDFEVRVTDTKLTDFVDEWIDIYKDKREDYFSREEDFAVLQYEFEYWSDRDLRAEEHFDANETILLGVFFDVFYPNELNSRIFGHTRMKNFRPECHKCHNRTLPTKENDGTLELKKRRMEGKRHAVLEG